MLVAPPLERLVLNKMVAAVAKQLLKMGKRYTIALKHIHVHIVRNWATGAEIVLSVRPRVRRVKCLRYKLF